MAVNFRPAKVVALDSYKVTRVACGSSHSIAWAELNVAPQILFDPVALKFTKDPLGMMYVKNEFEQRKNEDDIGQHVRRLRSSLSKYVLQLKTIEEKQTSLGLILESLRVCYARDALIKVLGDIMRSAKENQSKTVEEESKLSQATKSNAETNVDDVMKREKKEKDVVVLSLTKIKMLASLLKLGFSDRLNENQREELAMILVENAKKDKEVCIQYL